MASIYNFTLTDGTPLTSIYPLEGNGTGNKSIPRQILDINFDSLAPSLMVADDVTARFVNGFDFSILAGSPYAGSYTVTGVPTTETLLDGRIVTHLPLAAPPTLAGSSIVDVVTGTSGSWYIAGPTNGSVQFHPTSVFTVSGNSLPAANTTYTVASSITGNEFQVLSVVTGLSGHFVFTGDVAKFFRPSTTFRVVNSGYDQTYTISSVALVSGNTEVTVTGTIPTGTTVTVNTLVQLTVPVTKITISGIILAGAGADGLATPAAPSIINFSNSTPILVSPTTPSHYIVTFSVPGDQSAKFVPQAAFYPHNVLYNGNPYATAFIVTSSSYIVGDNRTDIVVELTDTSPSTPIIAVADTSGYQDVNFTAIGSGTDATGLLNDATVYTATITVDGVAKAIAVTGSNAQTFAALINEINTDLGSAATAVLDAANERIRVTSSTTGSASTVAITAGTLFDVPLANFSNIGAAVAGANLSWIVYPVPALPYGHIQYTVAPVSSSLQLIGPGCSSYDDTTTWGQSLQNNSIHMLEHFNNITAPVSPLEGQIWYKPDVPVVNVYGPTGWNSMVSINWPVQGFVDMNDNKIARLGDADTAFPYVASSTGVGNNDQEVVNLRTADTLYIAKSGGSSAVGTDRSGTMTGSLNINGASPIGASATGLNINSAPISAYGTTSLDFKTSGSGGITFESSTTGNITILGSGNVVVTNGNVTVGSGTDFAVLQNNVGAAPTLTYTTSTTGNAVINLANNKIVNLYSPSSALDATNKAYVDSLVNGIIWLQPVKDPNLFDDSLSAPPVVDNNTAYHKTYIVSGVGTGAWTGLDGRAVVYDPQTAAWVDILGRAVQVGDRFGVFCEPDDNDPLVSLPAGGLTGKAGKIVTIATLAPITYTDYLPQEPDAFSVTGANPTINNLTNAYDRSPHFGHSYTFRGTWGTGTFGTDYKWIEFAGPQMLVDGAGLLYTGNILNVGAGFGITVNADTVQTNQTDLDTIYLRRDGTLPMLGELNLNSFKIGSLASPTLPNDAVNKTFADTTYVALAGSTMNASANITFNGGQVLGLPATPTVGGAATSKTYVDNQDALRLALAGGVMDLNANITLSGTGEILGLPAVPTTGGSATSKTYVDTQLSFTALDSTVVHLAGIETITGAKTFNAATVMNASLDVNATTTVAGAVNVTTGANITLSGGSGEVLGLPAIPTTGGSATSKTYVDTQLALKPDDTLVVHLAGIETITGAKTFSAATVMNNSLTIAADGAFTNVTASTTGFTVVGTTVNGGGAYTVSLTAGQNTVGVGGSASLIAGQGSTTGGDINITSGAGAATAGGNILLTTGAGPSASTSGNITLTAGNAALLLDPQGVWKINNTAPSGVNQAIVSNPTTPATDVPSWQPIAHRVAAAPGSSAAAGNPGDWFADDSFFYVYGATGWRRIGISSF